MGVFRLRSSISLSVTVHALLVFAWIVVFGQQATKNSPRPLTWIELDPYPKVPSRRKSERLPDSKRIVQTELTKKSETVAPDAHLGKQTQTVDRQSVSKTQRTASGESLTQAKRKPMEAGKELSKLGIPVLPPPKLSENLADPMLDRPWAHGENLPQDYVKGLKEGERTALNTKEYVFFGYFQRIRQRLDLAWTRILRDQLIKLYRGGRQLASDMDHTTRIVVTLNREGQIVRVQVMEESGTRDLDDAAVKAFNRAGPFPNPPKGIADKMGMIQIRWDFVLKT